MSHSARTGIRARGEDGFFGIGVHAVVEVVGLLSNMNESGFLILFSIIKH